jgi:hypothetical protein
MANDNRRKCPVCGALTDGDVHMRRLGPPPPIVGENPRRRAQAAKIRKQNGGLK